jgi:hypothetical protein
MTIESGSLTDPAVRTFVTAVNAQDRDAVAAILTGDATMSDDGSDRDLRQWTDAELFNGHAGDVMEVVSESDAGRALMVDIHSDKWGTMRTTWQFTVTGEGKISRFETGQA